MRNLVSLFLLILFSNILVAQVNPKVEQNLQTDKMEWFDDAKLGIFIHWGIYSVNGIGESWSFYNGYISHEDYLKQKDGFNAKNYDPEYWASLIKESGAKYTVITSKHHDGFALWNSKYGDFNSKKHSAAKEDLLTPFVEAVKKQNLKLGLYYSLPDWTYEDYTHHTREVRRYEIQNDVKRWDSFVNYYQSQLKELKEDYQPDLWWFDGDWEHNAEEWRAEETYNLLHKNSPKVIINSRLANYGDYDTPEIGLPVLAPKSESWELCMTMNDSWGFQHNDKNYKSPQQIIDIFVDCISKGGNLLLDIGPKSDGSIADEQINILKELGEWNKKHKDAIFGSLQGIPYDHFQGPSTLSKDSSILYLFVRDIPKDGKILLKGIANPINRIFIVGNGTILQSENFCKVYWNKYPGLTYITIPENTLDKYYTVVAIVLDGKIDLYREYNDKIESN